MIKEAMEFILSLSKKVEFFEQNGEQYTNYDLRKIKMPTRRELEVYSLTGLVEYLKDNFDNDSRLLVTVMNERKVIVETELNANKERELLIVALADVPQKELNGFMALENFNIQLQSQFVPNEHREQVLSIIGNLKSENIKNVGDDGISQSVQVKQGVTMANEKVVPNPITLKPFRTFTEVAQPESPFVFRLRNGHRDETEAALFEADGGAWRNAARLDIAAYLKAELKAQIKENRILIIG